LPAKSPVIGAKRGKLPPPGKAGEAVNLEFQVNKGVVRTSPAACVLPTLNRVILRCRDLLKKSQEPELDVPMEMLLTS